MLLLAQAACTSTTAVRPEELPRIVSELRTKDVASAHDLDGDAFDVARGLTLQIVAPAAAFDRLEAVGCPVYAQIEGSNLVVAGASDTAPRSIPLREVREVGVRQFSRAKTAGLISGLTLGTAGVVISVFVAAFFVKPSPGTRTLH